MGDLISDDKLQQQQLNLNAPLLSARRISVPLDTTTSSTTGDNSNSARRSSLPFYKSDLKSGPVGKPGIVPFVWEQSPGRPKDDSTAAINVANSVRTRPKPPPGRLTIAKSNDLESEIEPPDKELAAVVGLDYSSSITTSNSASFRNESKDCFVESSVEKSKDLEERKVKMVAGNSRDEGFENGEKEDDEDEFADALDVLSRTDSFAMNCSVSGVSGRTETLGRFWTDPQARDFMIGRFLPAAQAVASSSPQCGPKRNTSAIRELPRPTPASIERNVNRNGCKLAIQSMQFPLGVDYAPELTLEKTRYDDDDEKEMEEEFEDDHSSHMVHKGCGLLPRLCLKGPFGLLNPVTGMKVRRRPPQHLRKINSSPLKSTRNASVHRLGYENSCEAVYKHKHGRGDPAQLEDASRPTSESNLLYDWSDSPTTDGSSPYRRSGSGISPYKNEAPQSPFYEGRGFLGTPTSGKNSSKDGASDLSDKGEKYLEATHSGSLKGSGSLSPGAGRTLSMDSVLTTEFSTSNLTFVDVPFNVKATVANDKMENSVSRICVSGTTQCISKTLESERPLSLQIRDDSSTLYGPHDDLSCVQVRKNLQHDDTAQSPLLPPPLPKSPSESWLWRTLPSVSSTNSPKSLLGIEVKSKKNSTQASHIDTKRADNKPSKPHRQIRFADVLVKPVAQHSEI